MDDARLRMYPAAAELVPGNAATEYYRAIAGLTLTGLEHMGFRWLEGHTPDSDDARFEIEHWFDLSLEELRATEIGDLRAAMANAHSTLTWLELAASRRQCDWEIPAIGDHAVIDGFVLHAMVKLGQMSKVVALRARYATAQGDYNEAIRDIQTNLVMTSHLGRGPTAAHVLTAIRIAHDTLNVIEELVQAADSPNLYWAIASIESPLFDIRPALASERDLLSRYFPSLTKLQNGAVDAEVVDGLWNDIRDLKRAWGARGGHAVHSFHIAARYESAKENLTAAGVSAVEVDRMPQMQVVVLDRWREQQMAQEEFFKWFELPWYEADVHASDAYEAYRDASVELEVVLTGGTFLTDLNAFAPDYSSIWARARLQEYRLAALRSIEAIRDYTARNEGRLPTTIDDVSLPVPRDPMSGEPFSYEFSSDKFTIRGAWPYVVTMTKE